MKNRDKAVIIVVAFVAIIAVVGLMTFNRYEAKKRAEQAEMEKTEDKSYVEEPKEEIQQTNTDEVEAEIVELEEVVSDEAEAEVEVARAEVTFSEGDTIIWPIDGNVILNYSMDQTVYFATLEQYKYNPALIISGEAGTPVKAAADGEVAELKKDAQTGESVVVNLGNGYTAIYGQLQEIRVQEGQRVEQGDVIGYLAEPTKYYSVEGPNLYFEMRKDGEPVNPLNFMEE